MRHRRRWLLRGALALGLLGLLRGEARADALPITSRLKRTNPNSVGLAFGMDGAWVLDAAFAHRFLRVFPNRFPLQLEARVSQPLSFITDYGGTRLGGTASALFYARNGLGVSAGVGPDVVFSRNVHTSQFAFGAEAFLRPGYWGDWGMIALDASYRFGYATCIIHRAPVDALYGDRYPGASTGPNEGCLSPAAQRLRTGLLVAVISPANGFGGAHLAGGFQYTPQVDGIISSYPMTAVPFYLQFGLSWVFR